MSLQIIILNTNSQPDGSFSVSGVFWLTTPSNNIVSIPNFQSQVPFIDPTNLLSLQYGNLVEQPFNSGLFAPGTSLSDVQNSLQNLFNIAQNNLTNTNSPISGLVGSVYDGYLGAWSSSNPFISNNKLEISSQHTRRYYDWNNWKIIQSGKNNQYQFNDNNAVYTIWFYDGPEVYICNIWKKDVPLGQIQSGYSQEQNNDDKNDFENNFKSNANKPLVIKDLDGTTRVSNQKPSYSKVNFFTHNFCDPTSWYQNSIYVSNEVIVSDGYYISYSLSHNNIIDTYHGKNTQEDFLSDGQGGNYRVIVNVDGYIKIEQDPHYSSGGDYTIDYENGKINFLSVLTHNNVVSVSYFYATNSTFTITTPGSNIRMDTAEVQFSQDIGMTDSILFEVWGVVDYFAPQMVGDNPEQIPSGTLIMLGNPQVYKSLNDLQNDSMKTYVAYPALGLANGGQAWRSCTQPILVFDWDYISATPLMDAAKMQVRIRLQHDNPLGGYFATASLYCSII